MELMKQQRHFLTLFVQTMPAQRKALLRTVSRPQVRAFSQIAHNVIKFTIRLTSEQKRTLTRQRRVVRALGAKRTGYETKRRAIADKPRLIYALTKIGLIYLEPALWKN